MATTKTVKGKKITLGDNVTGVNNYSLDVVADLLEASGNDSCFITSAVRDPFNQARVMYDALGIEGPVYWKRKYTTIAGDKTIDKWVECKRRGKTRTQTIAAMQEVIESYMSRGIRVSRHMGDPNKLQVLDISKRLIKNKTAFADAINQAVIYSRQGNPKGTVNHYVPEKRAFHIEIPQLAIGDIIGGIAGGTDEQTEVPSKAPVKDPPWSALRIDSNDLITLAELSTIKEYITYDIPPDELAGFAYRGKPNNERLWENLDLAQKKAIGNNDGSYDPNIIYPATRGTLVYIPTDRITIGKRVERNDINSENKIIPNYRSDGDEEDVTTKTVGTPEGVTEVITYSSNITVEKALDITPYPYVLKRLSLDPGYVPAFRNRGLQAKDIYPQLSIRAWTKVLGNQDEEGKGFIDLTCDIISCDINSRMDGGDFQIKIQPKVGYLRTSKDGDLTKDVVWRPRGEIEVKDGECVSIHNIGRERLYTDSRVEGNIASEYIRNEMWYNMIFNQNDIIWIKFERLKTEDEEKLAQNSFGEWWDMIALVDVVDVVSVGSATDVGITIKGRDLTKILQDDNSYFNPYSIGHASSLYGNTPFANARFLNGDFKLLSAIQARSLQQSVEFIFHRIASIGWVPDDVFDELADKTEITQIVNEGSEIIETDQGTFDSKSSIESKFVKGVWQCVKVFIDDSVRDLRIIDDSISNPDGSIWDILNKICQDPFVEMFTDTYGDKFYIIMRKPPFEKKVLSEIVSQITSISQGEGSVVGGARSSTRRNAYKEFLNSKQKNKVNSGTSTDRTDPNATKLPREVRQTSTGDDEPIVEYIPENDESRSERGGQLIDPDNESSLTNQSLGDTSILDERFPLIININEDDVFSDNLQFSNESYAWFQVTDRGNFAGADISLGVIPAIYFDEIAQIFGNRRLEVVSNYSNYKFFQSNRTATETNLYAEQASQHMAFLVETNIHLPFTRRGSIILNSGDRRIRKGNYIYYRPTQEVFYVTGVSNSISIAGNIDRMTRIEVERGMKLPYIKGVRERVKQEDGTYVTKNVSYFDIVDIPKLRDGVYDAVANATVDDKFDYKKNIKINKDVLNFFLTKQQFKQSD